MYSAATSFARRAIANSSWTRKRSRTCALRFRVSCRNGIWAMRCGWKWRIIVPSTCRIFCWSNWAFSYDDFYQVEGPVNLVRLMQVPDLDRPSQSEISRHSFLACRKRCKRKKLRDIFQMIRKNDILLHHPYQSFQPVIHFIQQAAIDPDVVAIKQTVYRTGTDSLIMAALIAAASSAARK